MPSKHSPITPTLTVPVAGTMQVSYPGTCDTAVSPAFSRRMLNQTSGTAG